jgi:centromere/kinetochore protein ZW10
MGTVAFEAICDVLSLSNCILQIPITVYVPHWSKFKQLTELLGMSLVSIVELWNNDTLHSVGFTKQEIISLIKAIFSDTEIRRERLKELK